MPRDEYWDDDLRRPRRDWRRWPRDDWRGRDFPPRKPGSTVVTTLGVVSIVAGAVELVVGLCTLSVLAFAEGQRLQMPGLPGIGGNRVIAWLLLAIVFFWGSLAIAAGVGLLFRGSWARFLTLILGAVGVMVGMLYMLVAILLASGFRDNSTDSPEVFLVLDSIVAVFFLGYGVFAYLVLLHPKRAQEFR